MRPDADGVPVFANEFALTVETGVDPVVVRVRDAANEDALLRKLPEPELKPVPS